MLALVSVHTPGRAPALRARTAVGMDACSPRWTMPLKPPDLDTSRLAAVCPASLAEGRMHMVAVFGPEACSRRSSRSLLNGAGDKLTGSSSSAQDSNVRPEMRWRSALDEQLGEHRHHVLLSNGRATISVRPSLLTSSMIARIANLRSSRVRSSTVSDAQTCAGTMVAAGCTSRRSGTTGQVSIGYAAPSDPRAARCARHACGSPTATPTTPCRGNSMLGRHLPVSSPAGHLARCRPAAPACAAYALLGHGLRRAFPHPDCHRWWRTLRGSSSRRLGKPRLKHLHFVQGHGTSSHSLGPQSPPGWHPRPRGRSAGPGRRWRP